MYEIHGLAEFIDSMFDHNHRGVAIHVIQRNLLSIQVCDELIVYICGDYSNQYYFYIISF